MSIILLQTSLPTALNGPNLRSTLITDATTIQNELNRIAARTDPVISDTGAITLGGVQRTTWPAAGGTASALNDVLQNGATGNLPAGATKFGINNTAGTELFSVDRVTGNMLLLGKSALDPNLLYKLDAFSPAFTKTGAGTLAIKAGASVMVFGVKLTWAADAAVTMPPLTAGTDYAIYACTDGTIRADASFTAPTGYTTANSRMIGGFHYGLIAGGTTASIANGFNTTASTTHAGTTANTSAVVTAIATTADLMFGMNVSGTGIPASTYILSVDSASQITLSNAATAAGSPTLTFTNTGMVWVQANVDDIAGINKYSLWDLKFRPAASSPKGMVLVGGRAWVDIYLCSTDTAANGTSKYNTNIASGTVLPKIPAAFGGNGTVTYPTMGWWEANELARANQKRMMWEHEFVDAMYGVAESHSIDATASTYPTTQRNAGYTSKYGIEQASGHHWIWGQDSNYYGEAASPSFTYKDVNGNTGAAGAGRGQTGTFGTYGLARVILGGSRASGSFSGSRASSWGSYPWSSSWNIGLRAACDHLQSV
jgi:hypothetical protein